MLPRVAQSKLNFYGNNFAKTPRGGDVLHRECLLFPVTIFIQQSDPSYQLLIMFCSPPSRGLLHRFRQAQCLLFYSLLVFMPPSSTHIYLVIKLMQTWKCSTGICHTSKSRLRMGILAKVSFILLPLVHQMSVKNKLGKPQVAPLKQADRHTQNTHTHTHTTLHTRQHKTLAERKRDHEPTLRAM